MYVNLNSPQLCVCVPNEDVDGLAVICTKHNMGWTQKGF